MQFNILKGVSVKGERAYRLKTEKDAEDVSATEESDSSEEKENAHAAGKPGRGEKTEKEIKDKLKEEKEKIDIERRELEKFREESLEELQKLKTDLFKEAEEAKEQSRKEGHEEGLKKGYDAGYEDGKKKALKDYEELKEEARNTVKEALGYIGEAKNRSREIVASSEKTLVELAMAVANKLLRDQLDAAPEKVVNMVKEAINSLPDGDLVRVYVNSEDLPVCRNNQQKLEEGFRRLRPNFKSIEFLPGEDVPRGSCRVESESGAVEFLLEEEKEQLKEEMMKLARQEEQKILQEDTEDAEGTEGLEDTEDTEGTEDAAKAEEAEEEEESSHE